MRSSLPLRPTNAARLTLALTPEEKRRTFAAAAQRGQSASQFIREIVARAVGGAPGSDQQREVA